MNPNGTHVEPSGTGDLSPEQALLSSFKSAATAVTQMYKDSMKQNRKSYQAGYEQCLQDLIGYISSHNNVQSQRARGEPQLRNSFIPASDLLAFTREKYSQVHTDATNSENFHNQRETQTAQGYQGAQSGVERHNVPMTPPFSANNQANFMAPTSNTNPFQGFEFESLHAEEPDTSFEMDHPKRRFNPSPERNFSARDTNGGLIFEPPYKRNRPRYEDPVGRNKHFF
ncbi:hypothetical protein K493DRAFT_314652 [Basidiobolus meristosporus CBS 931.73]|uniref:Uncharacterized protein n=1 Tax=Basidiobolus meristosporus CBS 931.73 TaxID=1314790 RepID=A0A1Y1YDR6_9FUNG|nr:hypothetical protein K493DRAFT_314652 [Basidiobolus meristosporus CBS 931.73]|eukprot:ORX96137.1 hypothetical protein K493DRAFT_314652 [Basidiobolus meristosporus CBS 931.73]